MNTVPLITVEDNTARLTPHGAALLGLPEQPAARTQPAPLDHAELEDTYEVELPEEFTAYAVFGEVADGMGGTCTVAYGSDGGGSALFCLSCEAYGIFEGVTVGGEPSHSDVEYWHTSL